MGLNYYNGIIIMILGVRIKQLWDPLIDKSFTSKLIIGLFMEHLIYLLRAWMPHVNDDMN